MKAYNHYDFYVKAKTLADHCEITERHLYRLIEAGLPKRGEKFPLIKSLLFYIKYLKSKERDGTESKQRLIAAKASQEEIKYKKLQGLVIDIEDVKSQAMQAMQILKEALFALPSVLSPKLEKKEKEEIYTILNDAVKKITNTIADKIQEQINVNESNISANTSRRGKDEDI